MTYTEKRRAIIDKFINIDSIDDLREAEVGLDEFAKYVEQEMIKKVVGALTSDISTSDFNDNGRSQWELNKNSNRGVEPCIECENATKIRTLLSSLQDTNPK